MQRKIQGFIAAAAVLLASTAWATTEGRIAGIITDVGPTSLTICPQKQGTRPVTGRLDRQKTRVVVDGRPASAADLQITYTAKAELGLDDVWVSVNAATK